MFLQCIYAKKSQAPGHASLGVNQIKDAASPIVNYDNVIANNKISKGVSTCSPRSVRKFCFMK